MVPHDIKSALDILVSARERVCGIDLLPVSLRERHVGHHFPNKYNEAEALALAEQVIFGSTTDLAAAMR